MMWLIPGLAVFYLSLLATFYYVPARRVIDLYPEIPSSAAAVPGSEPARQGRRAPEPTAA